LFLSTLPTASSSSSSSATPNNPENTSQTLIDLFGAYASPRELLVVVGETLEQAQGDVGDCFLDDEDDDDDDDDEDDEGLGVGREVRKSDRAVRGVDVVDDREEEEDTEKSGEKLGRVVRRVTAVLDILCVGKLNPLETFFLSKSNHHLLILVVVMIESQHSRVTALVNRQ